MSGGAGAAEWGVKTYGDANSQDRANSQDNTIKMNGGAKGGCWDALGMKTSRKNRSGKKKGGSLVAELATPIILFTAQQKYKSRRSTKKFSKNRKSRSYRRK